MPLSAYHQKYRSYSDEEIKQRVDEKRQELETIFRKVQLAPTDAHVKITVLGCGDKRFIKYHQEIFASLIKRQVEIITFDITIDHLAGEKNVIKHDCTWPLPNGPFDITYAHILLKFINTAKQWDLLYNSYQALKPRGLAIHILDKEDYQTRSDKTSNELFLVPLDKWKIQLSQLGVSYFEVFVKYGLALVMVKN